MTGDHKTQDIQKRIPLPLSFTIFFSVLNGMMFQVAVPDISKDFSLLPSEVSWVMTAYILIFALGALIYGKLADIYSDRSLITIGLILMNIGSLVGLFSLWYPMLIVARLVQAAGGAAIPALAMIVVTKYFPENSRGRVLGLIASTVAFAAGVGPIIGGFISESFHWRYLFVISLATIAVIPCFRMILPVQKPNMKHFDTWGALLVSLSTALVLVFVTENISWMLLAGVILFILFVMHIRRYEMPFVSPSLFARRRYRTTLIITFFSIGTVFGMLFMVPIMLSDLNSVGAGTIGLVIFPGAMSAVLLGSIGGRLSDRVGSTVVVYLGSALLIIGFLLLSTFVGYSPLTTALNLIVCYAGFAFLQSSLPHTVSMTLPGGQIGVGLGIFNLLFFISGAFSTAGIGRLLDVQTADFCLNPFTAPVEGWIYSNIFVMLAGTVATATIFFRFTFRKD
jgi:DHA2 family metal-tetracycline-proton antiporter-like MFS transporter